MTTTDRLLTLGQGPELSPEQAIECYWERLGDLDREVAVIRMGERAMRKELIIVCGLNLTEDWIHRSPYNVAIARISCETVSAVYDLETSSNWFWKDLNDKPGVTRCSYVLTEDVSLLMTPDSELYGDLERFLI